jgi:hypothetical protein
MDRKKKRKLRRSGTIEGARQVYGIIQNAMSRAFFPAYLETIPPVEFGTLFEHMEELHISDPLRQYIYNEARRRAEMDLLGHEDNS